MKEQLTKDPFETQCWLYDVVTDPYQVFAEAFSSASPASFRRFIINVLHFSETNEIFLEKSPCDTLFFMKIIRSVIKAADRLKDIKQSDIMVAEGDLFNKKYFSSHFESLDQWEEFPRFLSVREFCNPYKVFRKFFGYQDAEKWQYDLKEIIDTALSQCKGELHLEVISVYSHLSKLMEAAHLINVREVVHIGGILKSRFNNM